MLNLQELITRARFVFSDAPGRLEVFKLVNGKRSTKEIATTTKRNVNNIRRDLSLLSDVGLIAPKTNSDGEPTKKAGFPVYEKVPLARAIPARYFTGPAKVTGSQSVASPTTKRPNKGRVRSVATLKVPSENEILDIVKNGEDQLHEFKGQGTEAKKITREVAAMLNTKHGGLIFYGVDDDGTIQGTDVSKQKLDQPLQNSVRNMISPAATISLRSTKVLGSELLVIVVPPWNRKDVYQFDSRVLLRKGTNVFRAQPEEAKTLHKGQYII